MDLGKKIKSLRIGAGYTQEDLAGKLKISSQAVSKWENNICAPDIYVLPQLSVIFGITIDELFNLTTDEKWCRCSFPHSAEPMIWRWPWRPDVIAAEKAGPR